jgi:DNA-binding SARP family transcriptional activator/TolB-like protein
MAQDHLLRFLGGTSIEGPEGIVTGRAAQRHRLALLAVLAAEGRPVSRDKLVALLWPERPEAKARRALSDSIYRIHQALGDGVLTAVGDRDVSLDETRIRSDVGVFRAAVTAEDWAGAVDAYRGALLEGFHLGGNGDFSNWLDRHRRGLADDYRKALEGLGRLRREEGDLHGAVEALQLRAEHDPYDSRVAVRLIDALALAGSPGTALLHAQRHGELLQDELGLEPDPSVAAAVARIKVAEAAEPRRKSLAPVAPAGAGAHVEASKPRGDLPPANPPLRRVGSSFWTRRRIAAVLGVVLLAGLLGAWGLQTGAPPLAWAGAGRQPEARSAVAVLPFEDLSPGSDRAWLAAGFAEELIQALISIQDLSVISVPSDPFATEPSPQGVASTLGARFLVDGSVRVGGDSVWVSASLIDGETGAHLWGDTYAATASSEGLRAAQGRVAGRIAATVSLQLGQDAGRAPVRPGEPTYEAYLDGRTLLRGFQSAHSERPSDILESIAIFEDAVARNPQWADAWSSLGEAHYTAAFRYVDPETDHWGEARTALDRALSLDPDHPRAHASMGFVLHRQADDPDRAEAHFLRAFSLDSDVYWHCGYVFFLLWRSRYEDAIEIARRAEAQYPFYEPLPGLWATSARCAGRHEEAIRLARGVLARRPRSSAPIRDLALSLSRLGRTDEALATLPQEPSTTPYYSLVKALVLARAGEFERARETLDGVDLSEAVALADAVTSGWIRAQPLAAATLVALGDHDAAIELLEEAQTEDPWVLIYDRCYPELSSLESDPRYRRLLEKTGVAVD